MIQASTNTTHIKFKENIMLYCDKTSKEIISYEEYEYRYYILYKKFSDIPSYVVLHEDYCEEGCSVVDLIRYYNSTRNSIDNE